MAKSWFEADLNIHLPEERWQGEYWIAESWIYIDLLVYLRKAAIDGEY